MIDVRIQSGDFEPGRQAARLEALAVGAVASVTVGVVAASDVCEIHVDHYPPLARNMLARIAADAEARFGLSGIILLHRHGTLRPGERIAFAAVAAAQPAVALDACASLADALRGAPFWRRETHADGSVRWR